MKEIIIYRCYFTNADCYKNHAEQTPRGIQVHSTGANNPYLKRYVGPNDGRLGENKYRNYHNKPGLTVCANAYIGKLDNGTPAIYQTLPWNYRCWLSGSGSQGNANKLGYIGYEICEDNLNNKEYFEEAVMNLSVALDAYLCKKYNIPVNMIHDHRELHDMGLASNHGDIKHWLDKYKLSMDDYRTAVSNAIEEGVKVTYIDGDDTWVEKEEGDKETMPEIKPLYNAIVTAKTGKSVNLREQPTTNSKVIKTIPIGNTVQVMKEVDDIWDEILADSLSGYMMREFLKPENQSEEDKNIAISKAQLLDIRNRVSSILELIDSLLANT